MKKILSFIAMLLALGVVIISTSKLIMKKISDKREALPIESPFAPHKVNYTGDLARIAYLENVPQFKDTAKQEFVAADKGNENIDLYLFGDSFVKDIPDSVFAGVNTLHFGRRDYTELHYNLDTSKKNLLIIEITERFLRSYFYFPDEIYKNVRPQTDMAYKEERIMPFINSTQYSGFSIPSIDVLFNESINQNIEYNLFTYNFMTSLRTLKAEMNYYLFNRASGNVVISDDGGFLFVRESVNNDKYASSYVDVPEPLVSYYISVFNAIYEHYLNEGFDDVYLSVIPNPASVLQPENYNGFIPDLQNPNRGYPMKMNIVDVYSTFASKDAAQYFKHGDTHWNIAGAKVWIEKVNDHLRYWDQVSTKK
ncbi:MAG: hypothetical protein R2800_06455 [Flavipsychrobacter sp.]